MRWIFLVLGLLNTYQAVSQEVVMDSIQENLLYYSDIMINALEDNTRQRAAEEFDIYFNEYLNQNGTLGTDQNHLKYIFQVQPDDKSFHIVSWVIRENDNSFEYKAYIVFDDGTFKQFNRTDPLSKSTAFIDASLDDWYGCLYYKILELDKNEYLIFGYDLYSKFDKMLMVDYLKVEDKEVSLGSEIFEDKSELGTYLNRLIITYSSDASVNLNYNKSLKMIIQDHLEERMGLQEGQGPTNIPDGTYEGYTLEDGKWKYVEKIYNHVYEKPPRPKPVLNKKDKKVYEK